MILVFAGAGASSAVDRERYPTTVEFFKRLPSEISNDKTFLEAISFLRRLEGERGIVDVEKVLWTLVELRSFLRDSQNTSTVFGYFMDGDRVAQLVGQSAGNPLQRLAPEVLSRLEPLISRIHAQVYEFYGRLPEKSELAGNWVPLLKALFKRDERVEVFTTNYDEVIEYALEVVDAEGGLPQRVITGRRGSLLQPHLDVGLWVDAAGGLDSPKLQGLLTKLHGSVDWSIDGDRILVANPQFKGDHEKHVILYPGFKGIPRQEPFNLFHNHFRTMLERATTVIVIGFAFRDEYINDLIERHARIGARWLVIDPADKPTPQEAWFGTDRECHHVRKPFGEEGVAECLELLSSG